LIIILPTIGWAWPALMPLAGAVASALGYKTFSDPKGLLRGQTTRLMENMRLESVPLDRVLAEVVSDEIGNEERLLFNREDLVVVFRKDARGKFFVDVLGPRAKSALDLKIRGEEFAREMVAKFAYHKIAEQLARTGAAVVDEQVESSGRVTLRARKWR
jgi:hypothetical protein